MTNCFRRLIRRMTFAGQITLVICVFALLPMLLLAAYLTYSTRAVAVQSRIGDLRQRTDQLATQVEKAAELCNMSTQVFLNTPALIDHLTRLKNGEQVHGRELKAFYDNDIASLEKVVVGNPYLYEIRVYSVTDEMNELVPILYSASRMKRLPWAQQEVRSGTWQLDFSDQLFDSYAVTPHVMSLVTDITTGDAGKVGTLEVALKMESVLPALFTESEEEWAVLVDDTGQVLVGPQNDTLADAVADGSLDLTTAATFETELQGHSVLLSVQPLTALGCTYLQADSLNSLYTQMGRRLVMGAFCFALLTVGTVLLIHRVCRRMLRPFYAAFDAVNRFSEGDLNAGVPDGDPQSEVGRFSAGINEMLCRIRQLMQDNVTRELLGKNAELRALQNQINAHFIYNVLEAIKMMAEIDEEFEIADAVTNLAKLLRYSMKWTNRNATIAEEVDNIRHYLALMNLRFDDTVSLRLEIPAPLPGEPDILEQTIPKMSLQPIVENAVVHGIEGMDGDAEILLRAVPEPEHHAYRLEIVDHGHGMNAATVARLKAQIAGEVQAHGSSGNGLGLKNVQDRIHMAFGAPYGLTVSSEEGHYTKVTVCLPYTIPHDGPASGTNGQEGDLDENRSGSGR